MNFLLFFYNSFLFYFEITSVSTHLHLTAGKHKAPGLCFMPSEINYFPVKRIFSTIRT